MVDAVLVDGRAGSFLDKPRNFDYRPGNAVAIGLFDTPNEFFASFIGHQRRAAVASCLGSERLITLEMVLDGSFGGIKDLPDKRGGNRGNMNSVLSWSVATIAAVN
jgi:hypothetical protein